MNEVLLIILLIVIAGLAVLIIPQWRLKRAIPQVIRIFRDHNAVDIKNAKTGDELGLRPRGMAQQILTGRDYKLDALRVLREADIIQVTEDGRLYLSEEKLADSRFSRPQARFR